MIREHDLPAFGVTAVPTFLKAFVLIAATELADKTQLLTLTFAARLPARQVLLGVLIGTLGTQAFAVALGGAALLIIPMAGVNLAAGLAFIAFGLWTLRSGRVSSGVANRWSPSLLGIAASFFVAEMGDKTQLATAVLALETAALVPVWLGSSLGMVVANCLAVWAGVVLGRRLPERAIQVGATLLFVLLGLLLLREGLATAQSGIWPAGEAAHPQVGHPCLARSSPSLT